MPVMPAPMIITSALMFLCSFGNFRIGVSSIQTGTFLIFHCSLRVCVLAVRRTLLRGIRPSPRTKMSRDFHKRCTDIQTAFVDEPRRAVEHADELVAEVIKRLADRDRKSTRLHSS